MSRTDPTGAPPLPDLDRIAELAMLTLAPEERADLERDLREILTFAAQLPPAEDVLLPEAAPAESVLRPDAPQDGLTREELLMNAPAVREGCIVVPQLVAD